MLVVLGVVALFFMGVGTYLIDTAHAGIPNEVDENMTATYYYVARQTQELEGFVFISIAVVVLCLMVVAANVRGR